MLAHELVRQGGTCAICHSSEPGALGWTVDHDHDAAARHGHPVDVGCARCFRGILCGRCNAMLGQGRDDPAILRAGAEYLEARRR